MARYTGQFSIDPSDLAGGMPAQQPTPSTSQQPTPQQPPARNDDPSEGSDNHRRGWGKKAIIVVVVIGLLVAGWKLVPLIQGVLSKPAENPGTTQTGTPSGSQAPASDDNQGDNGSDNANDGSDTNNGQSSTTLTVAEQAAKLDPWFSGIPESNYVTKTAAELGGSTSTPLGQFCAKYCVVLEDGTVITRGILEDGKEAIPTIISDYTVPDDWYGTALALDEVDFNSLLVTSSLPEDLGQEIRGTVWQWSTAEGTYVYLGKGHSNLRSE